MEYCKKCGTDRYFKEIRRFPIPNGHKVWVSCEHCYLVSIVIVLN